MIDFIDQYRDVYGVESIRTVLPDRTVDVLRNPAASVGAQPPIGTPET